MIYTKKMMMSRSIEESFKLRPTDSGCKAYMIVTAPGRPAGRIAGAVGTGLLRAPSESEHRLLRAGSLRAHYLFMTMHNYPSTAKYDYPSITINAGQSSGPAASRPEPGRRPRAHTEARACPACSDTLLLGAPSRSFITISTLYYNYTCIHYNDICDVQTRSFWARLRALL
jgi:hypothetical protein